MRKRRGRLKLHVVYGTAVILLLGAIAYLIYHGTDTAVTLSYRDQQVVLSFPCFTWLCA